MVSKNQAETLSCYSKQFPDMVAENKTMRSTLKFKVTTKGIWNVSEDKSLEGTDGQRGRVSVVGSKNSEAKVSANPSLPVNTGKQRPEMSLDAQRCKIRNQMGQSMHQEANVSVKQSMPAGSGKRKPETSLDGERWKRQKMDRDLKLECIKILKGLMNHSLGWVFNEPVDPVKLKIPDYLEIIKNPMDLGTIKHKLERNMYVDAKEFAEDVKLTFENAKTYNPPSHDVHHWAETLDGIFSRRWKLLEAKLNPTKRNDEGTNIVNYTGSNGLDSRKVLEKNHKATKPVGFTKSGSHDEFSTSRPIPIEERQKTKPGIMKAGPGKVALNGCLSAKKTAAKGRCNQSASVSGNLRQYIDLTESKYSPSKNVAAQRSASDISSERSLEHNNCGDSKLDCEVKCTSASVANTFALDSDGPGVVLNEETSPSSAPATTPANVEGWSVDAQLSPKKALRAAMLKSRFADTIFRATHPSLKDHGEKSDLSRMQQERLRLEKEQLKEKARIEAQIKAAEAASRRKEQDDLKMRLARQREAARIALEKMEKTVELDKNASILKDLEVLFGWPGRTGYPDCEALALVGLHRKDEYFEEEEDAILNAEEGEIMG